MTTYPGLLVLHTCGANTPINDCVVFQNPVSITPAPFTMSFAYTATTIPGDQYTFSFGGNADALFGLPVGSFTCSVSNVVDPAASTISFTVLSLDTNAFIPESVSFQATALESVITCAYSQATAYLAIAFASFSLVRTA